MEILIFLFSNISQNSVSWNLMEKVILSITKISNQPTIEGMSALKDKFTQKMKILSLFTHPHADGELGKISRSTNYFWSFTIKQCCTILLSANWSICDWF